jgi:catechol 2,3-dioxygenase-like lactoylglutathione lyase family enzyme
VRRLDHTGITVDDLQESITLWRDVLGFELVTTFDMGGGFLPDLVGVPGAQGSAAVLAKGGYKIELLQYRAPDDRQHYRPRPCDVGSVHVALEVTDITAVVDACRARGVLLAGPIMGGDGAGGGTRMAYLHTPDGVTLELRQPPI